MKTVTGVKSKLICFVLAFVMLFGLVGALTGCGSKDDEPNETDSSWSDGDLILPNYDTEVITKTDLKKPKVQTFGEHEASYYPSYTNKLASADFDDDKKTKILAENQAMLADTKAWFEAGTLRKNLKKHVSADGQFSNAKGSYDKAPRIEKEITINGTTASRKRSLGVFAPAGEVLTITIDESMKGKLTVNIGYPYGDNDIGAGKFGRWPNDRMARFFLSFKLTETVTEIGSPLGGIVSLDGGSGMGNYKITVSGGIDMPDYKLGVSTQQDWQNILKSPAPYVWLLTPYQYLVMPKAYISDIEDPYNALLWWHKASMISMYAIAREDTAHFMTPIVCTFDSYVYVGEGVAATWAFYTNAPNTWCHGVLDYENLMYNGAWGAIHEYNHHHQAHAYPFNFNTDWGVGYVEEITNNVLSAASYILLTDIASTRSESNILGVWNGVSDPYCNYRLLKNASAGKTTYEQLDTSKLFGFVDMMHTFGADKFLEFIRAIYGYGEKVEGYDGKNMSQDASLTQMDNFALFACLFYKTDFVDYFTNVWHFNLSAEVIQKIKSHNFEPYFSINNLYSAGVKGVETGRAYKINVGMVNIFKFDEYTLASTDNYKLKKVSSPQHGTLTKNSDGTYSYDPDDDFTQDSFDLVYEVTLGGKTYTRTLAVKLTANYSYIETVTYEADVSQRGLSVQEAIAQFERYNNILSSGTAKNFTSSTPTGDNLTRYRASVVFPFSKQVTFMVYGDDKTLIKIDDKTAYTTTYIGNLDNAKKQETNKITMSVKEGEPLKIEAYCFNTGGNGGLQLKYSTDNGETYQDIPKSYCYGFDASKADIEAARKTEANVYPAHIDFRNLYLNKWYNKNSVKSALPVSAMILDDNGEPVKLVDGADFSALIDGTTSTWCHTAWRGTITPFPHNIFITFAETAAFNEIKFSFKNDPIGDYEIYASEDGNEYRLVKTGTNTIQSSGVSSFSVLFDTSVTAKYVKIVVKSQSAGKAFYNISEIEFLQTLNLGTDYNVSSSANTLLEYSSDWKNITGNYVNTNAKYTEKGTVKFYLKGTDLMLYATNAESTIKIDGVTYTIRENRSAYSPSFIIDGLSDGIHVIEIDANDMVLDLIKTTGYITNATGSGGALHAKS